MGEREANQVKSDQLRQSIGLFLIIFNTLDIWKYLEIQEYLHLCQYIDPAKTYSHIFTHIQYIIVK